MRHDGIVQKTPWSIICTFNIPLMNRKIYSNLLPVSVKLSVCISKSGLFVVQVVREGEGEVSLEYKRDEK